MVNPLATSLLAGAGSVSTQGVKAGLNQGEREEDHQTGKPPTASRENLV